MKKQRNVPQIKEQDKITADLSETKVSDTPDRRFKITIIKILPGLRKRVENISETLDNEIQNKNESFIDIENKK